MTPQPWPRPTVVVSQCLGFAACRWNGLSLPHPIVERLKPWVAFRPVCAEVEIGLGVPRQPVRVVRGPEGPRLMQPATGNDYTVPMNTFSAAFLDSLGEVGGFILKGQSPSCGWRDCKLYVSVQKGAAIGRTDGLFAAAVAARFATLPIETETRLDNPTIRAHFLTKLFTLARFGQARQSGTGEALVRFQTEHKLLLMG
jgi:uncharacterized protein YbbK (DUF523 family)